MLDGCWWGFAGFFKRCYLTNEIYDKQKKGEGIIMSSVLIDNWNLVNAELIRDNKGKSVPNNAYTDLLSALVLWDDVYYLDEGLSTVGWTYRKQDFEELLKPLYIDAEIKNGFERSSNQIYCDNYEQEYGKIIAQRAIYYSEISKAYKMNYLPVEKRADFLRNNIDIMDLWTRNEIIREEEKEILKRIDQFNKSNLSDIQIPLLANLILKNSHGSSGYLKTAIDVKNAKEVKRFREYMDKIDNEINSGNEDELKYLLGLIPQIVNDVQKLDKKIELKAVIKMQLSPTVINTVSGTILSMMYPENKLLTIGMLCVTLGALFKESNIEIKKEWNATYYPQKIQTTFLRNLAKKY
ncbi:MAG: hypothetical protein NC489_24110 [Ruminococcus flavefaciens]|nr:hypothetical protein [Ruminococcus flavefaciens]